MHGSLRDGNGTVTCGSPCSISMETTFGVTPLSTSLVVVVPLFVLQRRSVGMKETANKLSDRLHDQIGTVANRDLAASILKSREASIVDAAMLLPTVFCVFVLNENSLLFDTLPNVLGAVYRPNFIIDFLFDV